MDGTNQMALQLRIMMRQMTWASVVREPVPATEKLSKTLAMSTFTCGPLGNSANRTYQVLR